MDRHSEVAKYLKWSCDSKLLKGNAVDAIQYARKAYEEAIREPRLANPDPQLAAYRLGHLLMRNPSPKQSVIEEIIRLFDFATTAPEIGPLPKIYLIAALHRRLSISKSKSDQTTTKLEMEKNLNEAVKELRITSFRSDKKVSSIIQDYTFNMLELAAYMAGLPYENLEGLGIPDDWVFENESCVLIEANIGPEKLSRYYAKAIAMGAFKNNAPKVPCIGLVFTKEEKVLGLLENGKMKKTNKNLEQVQTLAWLLCHGERKISEIEDLFGNRSNLRKGKERLIDGIRGFLKDDEINAIEQVNKGFLRLADDVPVWAVIEKSQL
jgi:hypothetical protein